MHLARVRGRRRARGTNGRRWRRRRRGCLGRRRGGRLRRRRGGFSDSHAGPRALSGRCCPSPPLRALPRRPPRRHQRARGARALASTRRMCRLARAVECISRPRAQLWLAAVCGGSGGASRGCSSCVLPPFTPLTFSPPHSLTSSPPHSLTPSLPHSLTPSSSPRPPDPSPVAPSPPQPTFG